MIRRILEEMLRADGHLPVCVADGDEAVQAVRRQSFDLILLDLRMPVVDGLAAAAAIRAEERAGSTVRTPIIALTAAAPSEAAAGALPDDFDGYLLKPFTGAMLQEMLRRFVSPPTAAERTTRVVARLQGRQGLLNELVELFLLDAPKLLDDIQRAYEQDDRHRLKTAVHRLRGQLEMLEVRDAAEIARRLEFDCDQSVAAISDRDILALRNTWPAICRDVAELSPLSVFREDYDQRR
jgi:CheY-like chemotaxis protein